MMKLKMIDILLKLSYLLAIYCHAQIVDVRLPHDLVDNELRIIVDVKLLDLELRSDAQAVDEGLIFCHIIRCMQM
jgi:hypothetical protein